MSEKKRNAIILTGFLRNYEETVKDLKKNLRTSDDIDLFITTWNFIGIKKINKKEIILSDGSKRLVAIKDKLDESKVNQVKVKDLYKPTAIRIFDLDLFEESIISYAKIVESSNLIDIKAKIKPKNYLTLMRRYCIFFMNYQGWKLMEEYSNLNNIKYSKVIKIRSDFEKGGYYPKINWSKRIPKDTILIGDWNLQQYSKLDPRINFDFQDHFAMGELKNMSYYFNIFNNLHNLSKEFRYKPKMWHAEYCLSLWLMKNNINCKILKRNILEKGRFDYLEIGSSCFKTLAEVYRDNDDIKGLTVEPVTLYLERIKEFCKYSKNKYFYNGAIAEVEKKEIDFFFIDPKKIKNWVSAGVMGLGCTSESELKSTIKKLPEYKLNESMIKQTTVKSLSFKKLIEKYKIDSIGFLKVDTEGEDYNILMSFINSDIECDAIQFEAKPFMSDTQIKKIISQLKKKKYICKDLENNKRNFYCAKQTIVFDKYLNLPYENKNIWMDRINNRNIFFQKLISHIKNKKIFIKKILLNLKKN